MLTSEKRSLIRFLLIYLVSTFLLFSISSWIFYNSTKKSIIEQQKETLHLEAQNIISKIRALNQLDSPKLPYPNSKTVKSAIFDLDKNYIFGTLDKSSINSQAPNSYIKETLNLHPYYLGAAYLVVQKKFNPKQITKLQQNIVLFLIAGGVLFLIIGYFLGKLFIAPMKESINKMNHFIQDATHELNTPISTILTNIELIETFNECKGAKDELNRISIASKTLSRIYEDLTYLNLNHKYHTKIEPQNISQILQNRVVYFNSMIEAKLLKLKLNIEPNIVLDIDKNDILRVIDNLISNAIKYNKTDGELNIELNSKHFRVTDSGIGIEPKDLATIKERFKRANSSEGGFGIGLDIVQQIVNRYNFSFTIKSQKSKGTEVTIKWQK